MTPRPIAIVGAGPAGSLAAWHLARRGAPVLLFDPSHPREKPCGGGLTGRALALAAEAIDPAALEGVPVAAARFGSGDFARGPAAEFEVAAPGASPLLIVSRRAFDGALLEAACRGGATHVPERVRDVETSAAGVVVRTDRGAHEAQWVLGADGSNSLVRKRLLGGFRRNQLSLATGVYAHGLSSRTVIVHTVADPPGYIWSFPRPDHLAVGICAPADRETPARLRAVLERWLAVAIRPGAALEPYSWPIPSLAYRDFAGTAPAGPRWMLLGDAAGLVDPLTREGIFFALESGRLAAEALLGSGEPAAAYSEGVRRRIYPELARAAALKARFFSSTFADLLVDGLSRSAAIRRVMVDLIAGRQPYRTLRRRLLATFEVRLAWQLAKLQVRGMRG
ncbi:MAG: geranylgeranyl reductase [Acidobacteria bacterium]|nr:geranylgeranyl reductase [Acidobacteriota bacterium]